VRPGACISSQIMTIFSCIDSEQDEEKGLLSQKNEDHITGKMAVSCYILRNWIMTLKGSRSIHRVTFSMGHAGVSLLMT